MNSKNYLMIENNVVTNVIMWDGNTDSWQPPLDATMLVQSTTNAFVWVLDTSVSPSVFKLESVLGAGQIGFTWDGTNLTTNEPEPEPIIAANNQPKTTGTTTI